MLEQTSVKDLKLTDDTVKNIQIMAPYLDEKSQNRVFGLMFGLVMDLEDEPKKAG